MRILIVLLVAILCAVAGAFIGGSMVDTGAYDRAVEAGPRTRDQQMQDAMRAFSAGADVQRQRSNQIMIGGGIGLVVGIGVGALAASKLPAARRNV